MVAEAVGSTRKQINLLTIRQADTWLFIVGIVEIEKLSLKFITGTWVKLLQVIREDRGSPREFFDSLLIAYINQEIRKKHSYDVNKVFSLFDIY